MDWQSSDGIASGQRLAAAPMSTILSDSSNVASMMIRDEGSRKGFLAADHELVIEPGRTERHYWRDLWQYRELFSVLAWRDISVRYKQTVIGAAWALIRPFLTMVVFTVIFGKLAKLPSDGAAPYALMVFAGMLPWTFFASALSDASMSLIGNANLISKVYFPRLIVPMAAVMVAFLDFLISFGILVVLMVWYAFLPGWQILLLPGFAAIAFITSFGVGVWITALNVKYRDFRYVIPFLVQLGLYVSPVGFSSSIVPDEWRLLYSLNPIVGVIDGFRWCILGGESRIYWPGFWLSLGVAVLFLWLGIRQFRKMEKSFADLI
jgi:lipopolysaccharide transport system permease protein